MRITRKTSRSLRIVAALALAGVLGGLAGGMAQAEGNTAPMWSSYDDEIADAKAERERQAQQSADLEDALTDTDVQIAAATKQLQDLNARLPVVQQEYEAAQNTYDAAVLQQQIVAARLEAAQAEDESLTEQIAADNDQIAELERVLAQVARTEYQGADTNSSLSMIFGAQSSSEFVDEYTYSETRARVQSNTLADLEELAAVNRNRQTRQEAVRVYIADLKVQADELVVQTQAAKDTAEAKKQEVEDLLAQTEDLKNYLESQRQRYLDQQAELDAQRAALQAELDALVAKKLAEEAANGTGSLEKGFLSAPTAVPYITSSYGWRLHPILGYYRLHAGTDFRAYCGTPILAAADGRVEWAKYVSGLGNQVMLDNGIVSGKSLMTSYNHLTSFAVSSGQNVSRGQIVGYSGTTGTSSACHLHFEVYVNGSTVDPMTLVDW